MRILKKFLSFLDCQNGVAYVEFALSISMMMLLFLGSVEASRAWLIIQKLEKVTATVPDVVTQTDPNTAPLTTSQLSQVMSAVTDMMSPYTLGANDPSILVIVTDVAQSGANNPVVNWQYCGGGTLSKNSAVGTTIGGVAVLPNGFTMNAGEEIVIGEVFYNFRPMILNNKYIGNFLIYKTSIYVPRLGALTGFSSHC